MVKVNPIMNATWPCSQWQPTPFGGIKKALILEQHLQSIPYQGWGEKQIFYGHQKAQHFVCQHRLTFATHSVRSSKCCVALTTESSPGEMMHPIHPFGVAVGRAYMNGQPAPQVFFFVAIKTNCCPALFIFMWECCCFFFSTLHHFSQFLRKAMQFFLMVCGIFSICF